MKIKQMIFTLFISLALIPLSILGIVNMIYYNGKLEKLLENDLQVAASTQVESIESFFDERRADALFLSGLETVKRMFEQEEGAREVYSTRVSDILKLRAQYTDFVDRIFIVDTDFKLLADSGGNITDAYLKNLESSYFGPALQFTHVINDGDRQGDRFIAAIQGICNEGEIKGYLIAEINIDFFEKIRASAKLFNNGTVYIVDNHGQIVVAGDNVSARNGFALSARELMDYKRAWVSMDSQAASNILRFKAQGIRYMSCYVSLSNPEWKVITSVDMDRVLRYKSSFLMLLVLITATLAVLLILVNYLVRRYFAVPIDGMIDKFRQIQDTGDYTIRMEETVDNEIGVITSGVNSLLASIENYVNQEKEKQEQLRKIAERDPLTGLFNKKVVGELLNRELERMKTDQIPRACLFIDIDDFKEFNTRFGHIGGDKVVQFVAETLEENFPGMSGRQGGDEFVAVIRGGEYIQELKTHIMRIIKTLNEGITLEAGAERTSVRCSIGAVVIREGNISCDEVLSRADEAMYRVKSADKNGYFIWTD